MVIHYSILLFWVHNLNSKAASSIILSKNWLGLEWKFVVTNYT